MAKLTKKYIQDHLNVHTADSWGRALGEQILRNVEKTIGDGELDNTSVDVKFHVTAFEPKGCIRICGVINGVYICYHVNV
jgi:hypothetical protein